MGFSLRKLSRIHIVLNTPNSLKGLNIESLTKPEYPSYLCISFKIDRGLLLEGGTENTLNIESSSKPKNSVYLAVDFSGAQS